MKQALVGHFPLGAFNVEVYIREGTGAEFYYRPDNTGPPRMKVGADQDWHTFVGALLHEAAEFSLANIRCRFQHDDENQSSDRFVFHADHYQFSTMTLDVGAFLALALPRCAGKYGKWKKVKR